MNQSGASPDSDRSSRSELRRQQVLDAAAECFRRYGFHGASVAQISKLAGMSAGHIYHFFENKEAIIGAIVEQNVERGLELVARFEAEPDVFGAMVERVDVGLAQKTAPDHVGLWLEVLAEAARNPNVARIVQTADRKMRERLVRLVENVRRDRGTGSAVSAEVVTDVVMALFEGLANRKVQHPDSDVGEMTRVLRVAARAILEA